MIKCENYTKCQLCKIRYVKNSPTNVNELDSWQKKKTPSKYRPRLPFGYFKTGMYKYLIKMKLESNMSKLLKINPL